jgi:hypothetical protein
MSSLLLPLLTLSLMTLLWQTVSGDVADTFSSGDRASFNACLNLSNGLTCRLINTKTGIDRGAFRSFRCGTHHETVNCILHYRYADLLAQFATQTPALPPIASPCTALSV